MTWTTRPRSEFGSLAAIRAGAGAPLLLLHGVGLRAEAWAAQVDALSGRFAVIAPDMPGHGESGPLSPVEAEAGLAAYTDRVAAALERPVWVAGHSMGALIALDLADRHPERVLGVAAMNGVYRRSAAAAKAVLTRASALDGVSPVDPSGPIARWFGGAQTPEAAACRAWLGDVDPAGYRTAYSVFARSDGCSEAGLTALEGPALFLTGARDPNSTPAMSEAMAAAAPRGRAEIIEEAAHMAPMTHPERVTAALSALLSEEPA